MPVVDGGVVLHARIAADPGRFGDLAHQVARLVGLHRLAVTHRTRRPLAVVQHRAHELVGDADAVVRVLEEHRRVGRTGERAVIAGIDQRPGLLLFLDLAVDELFDVGVLGVEDDHLGGTARLAARLDDARKRVEALHERDGTGCGAAAGEQFLRGADGREVRAGAGSELEQHPFGLRQTEDGVHRVLHGIDEAGRALRMLLEADVEPDRAVERRLLIDEQVLQVVAERLLVIFALEVLLLDRPARDGVDDASDQLLDGALALRGADRAAEILGDDDVRRLLRPEARDLDVALFENNRALFVADDGGPRVPFDLVERVDALPW